MTDQITPELIVKIDHVIKQLSEAQNLYGKNCVLANSLGAEDMVLVDLLARAVPDVDQFVIDTGRLPEETLSLLAQVTEQYPQAAIHIYYPEFSAVQSYVSEHGINAFYQSQTLRQNCCAVRKLEPLKRALTGRHAWITGLRREQSITRDHIKFSEWDEANGLYKLNPLANWLDHEVWAYLHHFKVPYNILHDQHYASIGCAPCTRAVSAGEDRRAGRWWWENPETRECGLHVTSGALPS